ncbi:MAG: hypothetical protein U9R25_00085 [Chloroflexota bacterium]|nr:hypothetical protein [Chloroflexota bacterium]
MEPIAVTPVDSHPAPLFQAGEQRGNLVAVEGIDGSGKSTLVAHLFDHLSGQGRPVFRVTRYMVPALTRLWLRLVEEDLVDQYEAAALAVADYYTGLANAIGPALDAGKIVLADRYHFSHQVHFCLRGVDPEQLQAWFAAAQPPILTIYLEVPVGITLDRLRLMNKPDFWECGLDHRPGMSIGKAWRQFLENRPSTEELEHHFYRYQSAAKVLFQQILPPSTTVILDGTLPSDELLGRCLRLLDRAEARQELLEGQPVFHSKA